ncbi:MAG TPA: DHA2 family efflux MFS transporter permease subunit [Stellaceae bacterium]|nr:DHA2 family efflux MFS transporter permease subunit [Stellaceae bacterium]
MRGEENRTTAPAPANRAAITISIMLATIMQALDTTIANVALPHIQGSLSAAQDQVTWILTSYIVAAAIMTPLTGWLAGAFGIKRVFLASVAGFTVASALCGAAQSLGQIVAFRLLQGACGAALVPLSQAVLLRINPPERHGQAMAVWGTGIMVGPILGPVVGGWLTDNYDWRWVFYINLPVGIVAFLGIFAFIRETRQTQRERFDFLGFVALSIAIGALQLLLDRGQLKDWFGSIEIWIEALVAGLAFYLFVVHTMTTRERAFLNPDLLRDRNFMAGIVLMFFISIILFATLALLPTMMQQLMNYPVVTTGLATAPRGIGTMIAMFLVGRIINRIDIRLILLVGLGLTALSLAQMSGFSLLMGMSPIVVSGFIQGFGLGLVFVPLSTISFATLSRSVLTQGTAVFSLMRNIGSSIGISIVEALLIQNTQTVHARLVENLRPDNPLLQSPHHFPAPFSLHTTLGIEALNALVNRQAAMVAYIDDFKFMMIVVLLAVPLLLLLRKPRQAGARGPSGPAPRD